MNRNQAGHILDAYVRIRMREGDEEAADALREVILDAMTSYSDFSVSSYPRITLPSTQPFTTVTTPNVIHNKPIVTCDTGGIQ